MRHVICAVALCAALLGAAARAQAAPEVSCKAYLLYDLGTRQVVALKNPEQIQPVASLTKMMTAVLACENLRFDGRYVLTPEEQKTFKTESMRADKMLELALVASNNAICKTMSRIIAGDETKFAKLMNARARDFGMNNTRYVNASGLPGDGQYSTMEDMLRLTLVALQYPLIRQTMQQRVCVDCGGHQFKPTLGDLYNRHPQLLGGKTGYTKAAGRCLILLYTCGGHDYVLITLGSSGVKASFRDAEILLKCHGLYSGAGAEWK
jgi:D-alanyl-D-alanine carboxypeptidase (penicillin-binding protein 5/6)